MIHRDDIGARMAMWLFMFTELMLFGTLFIVYGVFRTFYGDAFIEASSHLDKTVGGINTIILLVSSLTMGLGLVAMKRGNRLLSLWMIIATIALAVAFFINKVFEWAYKIDHGIFLNTEHLNAMEHGQILFYSMYFVLTGIHGFHILCGLVLLTVMAFMVGYRKVTQDDHVTLENSGLYWHLVDLVWAFVFPLFYLVG
jgi:cytochrome c oxidase subunit 3